MFALSPRASFWVAGAVVALALWTSACPTMTYPLYEAKWQVSTTTITWIFAAYPMALVPVLVLLGDVSDHIGRRVAILIGLIAELAGVLLFVAANDVALLVAGRAFMGLGVGLSLSPANVAMVEFSAPGHEKRAHATATGVQALGIALAMVVGGALTEYAPLPLRLNFVVLAAAIGVVGLLVTGMPGHGAPGHPGARPSRRWRVRASIVPHGNGAIFVAGSLACASSFLLGAIVLPLGAAIAHQLAGSTNALVTGALLSVFAVCIGVSSLYARRFGEWRLVFIGAIGSIGAVWLYVATGAIHSLVLFFLASACAGAAYACNFAGGLTVLSRYTAPQHRASMVSGGYLVGYLSQGLAAPFLGWVVTRSGLMDGLIVGAVLFTAFYVAAILICHRVGRRVHGHLALEAPVGV